MTSPVHLDPLVQLGSATLLHVVTYCFGLPQSGHAVN